MIQFCTLVPNIAGCSVWNVLHDKLLALRISRWLLYFSKICGSVGEAIIVALELLVNCSQFSGLENILLYDMHSVKAVHYAAATHLMRFFCLRSVVLTASVPFLHIVQL
jgi:hypothetical protein